MFLLPCIQISQWQVAYNGHFLDGEKVIYSVRLHMGHFGGSENWGASLVRIGFHRQSMKAPTAEISHNTIW